MTFSVRTDINIHWLRKNQICMLITIVQWLMPPSLSFSPGSIEVYNILVYNVKKYLMRISEKIKLKSS